MTPQEPVSLLKVISSFVSVYKTFQAICLRRLIWRSNTKNMPLFSHFDVDKRPTCEIEVQAYLTLQSPKRLKIIRLTS